MLADVLLCERSYHDTGSCEHHEFVRAMDRILDTADEAGTPWMPCDGILGEQRGLGRPLSHQYTRREVYKYSVMFR